MYSNEGIFLNMLLLSGTGLVPRDESHVTTIKISQKELFRASRLSTFQAARQACFSSLLLLLSHLLISFDNDLDRSLTL
jgi:hypothetical protein